MKRRPPGRCTPKSCCANLAGNSVFLAYELQDVTRAAFLVGIAARTLVVMMGNGVHHASDVSINLLLSLDYFLRQALRAGAGDGSCWNRPAIDPCACGSPNQAGDLGKREANIPDPSLVMTLIARFFKDTGHFFGEPIPMSARIQQQHEPIGAFHSASHLTGPQPCESGAR